MHRDASDERTERSFSQLTNEVLNFIQDQMHRDASDERTERPFSQLYSRKPVVVLFYHYL